MEQESFIEEDNNTINKAIDYFNNAQAKLAQKDQTIILYCQTGARSKKAYQTLKKLGYQNVYEVKGGINN